MDNFINSSLYLKKIPEIAGWGVFTKERIKTGETIEVSPVFLYPKKILDLAIFCSMSEGVDVGNIGIDRYAILWDNNESMPMSAVMLGYLSIYNHSNNNNSYFAVDIPEKQVHVITKRDIQPDEQLTVSYGPNWFEQKKGYINYVEF